MFLQQLWQWLDRPATASRTRPVPRRSARLTVEPLEDRAVPALFTAASVPELIDTMTAANQSPEADTITLAPGTTFTLRDDPEADGVGLPVIDASGGALTIIGNGDVIERSTAKQGRQFRLMFVRAGATLTLENLTLQGGKIDIGGAIYNLGTLTMRGVTVQNNSATVGGGIYSDGSLMLHDCLIQNNQALGSDGSNGSRFSLGKHDGYLYFPASPGGWGVGGGVYVAGGTAVLLDTTVTHNTAFGGQGGQGKYGQPNAPDGSGQGGGMYIESDAVAVLDAFTVTHVMQNTADFGPDIYGPFSII